MTKLPALKEDQVCTYNKAPVKMSEGGVAVAGFNIVSDAGIILDNVTLTKQEVESASGKCQYSGCTAALKSFDAFKF